MWPWLICDRITTLASKLGLELALIHTDTTAPPALIEDGVRSEPANEYVVDTKASVVGNVANKTCFVVVSGDIGMQWCMLSDFSG